MPEHLLLVEDNASDALLLQSMLDGRHPGQYAMVNVVTLKDAKAVVWQDTFAAVLLDLSLPDSHGLETIGRLAAAAPNLPIVVLTGVADEAVAREAVRCGAQDYLVKGQADAATIAQAIHYAVDRKQAEEAKNKELQESQRRLETYRDRYADLYDFAPLGYVTLDEKGHIQESNLAGAQLLNADREVLTGYPFNSHVAKEDMPVFGESDVFGRRVETVAARADGSEFPAELTVVRMRMSGTPVCVGFLRDITATKHRIAAQEAIHNILAIALQPISLEGRLERMLDTLFSVPWLRLQSKGAVLLAAETEGGQVLVRAAQRGLPDGLLSACARVECGTCLCGRAAVSRETVFAAHVDEAHEIRYQDMPPHGHYCLPILPKDELLGVLCLYVDEGHQRDAEEQIFLASVTDVIAGVIRQVQTAESLRKSEERFDLAVRGTDAGIWDWDLQAGTVYFSARWKSMLGYDENEIGDQFCEWESRLHPLDRERALKTVREYLAGRGAEYELEHRLRHKDGNYRWILARGAAIRDEMGKAYRMVGSQIDITARKTAEEHVRQNEIQLLAAQKIQEALLPTVTPSLDWLDIAGVSHPAAFVGGDYFDYLPMLGGALGVVVGDVTGHGLPSALLMASTQAFLRCLAQICATVAEIVVRVNNFIANETEADRFVTQLLVRLDPKTRSLTYINAGHPAGYVLDSSGCVRSELTGNGLPLGIMEDGRYSIPESLALEAGDILVILTDGILEAKSPRDEVFGCHRALDAVQQSRDRTARGIVEDLMNVVAQFCGGGEAEDDRTALVVKVAR